MENTKNITYKPTRNLDITRLDTLFNTYILDYHIYY